MSFGDSEDTNLLHNKNVRIPKPAIHKPSDEQTQDRGDSTITCVGSTCTLLKTSREPRIVPLEKEHQTIHPRNLTWNPKMEVWKMIFLFNLGDF